MSVAVPITVGTNSYIDLPEANTHFNSSLLNPQWVGLADDDTRCRALITASAQINLFVIDTYKLSTPPLSPIPENLAIGTAEYALVIALNPSVITQVNTGSNVKRLRAGEAEIEYFRDTFDLDTTTRFPQHITDILGDCLASTSGIEGGVITPFTSGTDQESSFSDQDRFGYDEGL